MTTGFVKLGAGGAAALVLAGAADGDRPARVLIDGALIALAANLANLLDRAPGRTIKWALVAYLPLAIVAGTAAVGVALGAVAGAALALLAGDVRERFMLGDAGANALGAALGMAAVLALGPGARTIVAGVLLALTLLSEVMSFSRIIAAVSPLRQFDRLGRLPIAVVVLVAVLTTLAGVGVAGGRGGGGRYRSPARDLGARGDLGHGAGRTAAGARGVLRDRGVGRSRPPVVGAPGGSGRRLPHHLGRRSGRDRSHRRRPGARTR